MPNPATPADVAARWRPLTSAEDLVAATLLEDAWVMLKTHATRRGVDIEDQITTDVDLRASVIRVLATAVLRVLKNPEGKTQESIDDYAYTRSGDVAGGALGFTDDELGDLLPGLEETGRAFSVDLLGDYAARFEDTP
ncbi:MAG: Gp19/Gp15/Gp42 family protein [Pseudonocardiaceae bacterium]